MKRIKFLIAFFCVALFPLALAPNLKATALNRATYVTFNAPVEIPGAALTSGTYVFKLANALTDNNIVQVFEKGDGRLVATVLTIVGHTPNPSNAAEVTLYDASASAPQPVKAWLYPGDNALEEFVYPRTQAIKIARAANEDVPAAATADLRPGKLLTAKVSFVTPLTPLG